jgi:hypothetical protein
MSMSRQKLFLSLSPSAPFFSLSLSVTC